MSVVIHIISSLNRGGRERQLAGILSSEITGLKNLAVVFNKGTHTYVDEYNLYHKVIFLRNKQMLLRLFELYRIIKRNKPDIIWSWGGFEATFCILISLMTRVKHVNGSVRHGVVLKTRKHQWRRFLLKRSKYVVGNSKAGLLANGIKNGYIIYNGLDQKFFQRSTSLKENVIKTLNIELTQKTIIIVSVANLVPYKDYTTVLKALNILKREGLEFYYLIIGEGPERVKIEQTIRDLKMDDKVLLLGRRNDIKDILAIGDIFVHSSKGEGCSNAILEAMAAGMPIVATNTGGTSEIVKSEYGFLFDYGNYTQLGNHIRVLYDNPELIAHMKQHAREYALQNFNMDRMIRDYQNIVNRIIHS